MSGESTAELVIRPAKADSQAKGRIALVLVVGWLIVTSMLATRQSEPGGRTPRA